MDTKKLFCLEQIAPYYKDPNTCGFDGINCCYLTSDGKMCVLGKNLIDPGSFEAGWNCEQVIETEKDRPVLKPEVRGILTTDEWQLLQYIHDVIAQVHHLSDYLKTLSDKCSKYNLFTLQELQDYCT
mgnify:FL=1